MSAKLKFGLARKTLDAIKTVFEKHPKIEKAIIYGSRAKGNYRPGSDIDLTLIAPQLGVPDLLKIENDIEELMLPYKVDLSLFHLIENPEVIEHINRVGKEF